MIREAISVLIPGLLGFAYVSQEHVHWEHVVKQHCCCYGYPSLCVHSEKVQKVHILKDVRMHTNAALFSVPQQGGQREHLLSL